LTPLCIRSNIRDYSVHFEQDFAFMQRLSQVPDKVVIVDGVVHDLYPSLLNDNFTTEEILRLEAIEHNKDLSQVSEIYEFLIKRQAKKNLTIISIGGGITQDVTGFVASTLYRGVPWFFVPTTLLAQTDSCIGSKTSLNFKAYKNLIGTFYPPHAVYINPAFLTTLSEEDFYSGFGEAIKLQIMKEEYPKDIEMLESALSHDREDLDGMLRLIRDCLQVKIGYMQDDEFDQGKRNLLNYGHTMGHAVEASSGYAVSHGVAVVIGMIFADIISVHRGLLEQNDFDRIVSRLMLPNILVQLSEDYFSREPLISGLRSDKKRIGKDFTFIIPDGDLRLIRVDDVKEDEFDAVLAELRCVLRPLFS
jgi:3-dehydroquinate synthase